MSKQTLQAVGDDTIAFGDQCYWVAENVKRFLNNFQPGMEVDVTVKDVDGTPMVTFLKKSGFAPAGAPPKQGYQHAQTYQQPRSTYQQPQKPAYQQPPKPAAPASNNEFLLLAATLIAIHDIDPELVKLISKQLKEPIQQFSMPDQTPDPTE